MASSASFTSHGDDVDVELNSGNVDETKPEEMIDKIDAEKTTPSDEKPRSVLAAGIDAFKYLYCLILLVFCLVLVMGAIFTKQPTITSKGFPTVAAFLIFWFLILWLAMMEGGQGALVGLQPVDSKQYEHSHPLAFKNRGDNMERFIVGRQFLVVLIVFVSQLMSSAIPTIDLWGMNQPLTFIFLNSGVALIILTIVLGQLTGQVNAAKCMLDFINNYFMLYFVTYISLAIEFSGLLHCVYLVQIIFSKLSGQATHSEEPPMNARQQCFFWL
jgi:Silicon transporter